VRLPGEIYVYVNQPTSPLLTGKPLWVCGGRGAFRPYPEQKKFVLGFSIGTHTLSPIFDCFGSRHTLTRSHTHTHTLSPARHFVCGTRPLPGPPPPCLCPRPSRPRPSPPLSPLSSSPPPPCPRSPSLAVVNPHPRRSTVPPTSDLDLQSRLGGDCPHSPAPARFVRSL
jgi:hypothetical protein